MEGQEVIQSILISVERRLISYVVRRHRPPFVDTLCYRR
jgi:hypothetical protein